MDKLFLIFEAVHLAVSMAILIVLLDDVYGIPTLRAIKNNSKRKVRKYWKKFMKDTTKYFRKRPSKDKGRVEVFEEKHIGFKING